MQAEKDSTRMNGATEPPRFTLQLRTTLEAPPANVFQTLSDADEIRRWFGPEGYTPTHVDLDLREEGTYRITMRPLQGEDFHIRGVFREVVPAERLAFTFVYEEPGPDDVETLVTLTLSEPTSGLTELALEQSGFATEDRLKLHRGGWEDSFERLGALIAPPP
jgi:uncharacterized protein YndB with AHSA1/START domain